VGRGRLQLFGYFKEIFSRQRQIVIATEEIAVRGRQSGKRRLQSFGYFKEISPDRDR
jgi:hypothetical protein